MKQISVPSNALSRTLAAVLVLALPLGCDPVDGVDDTALAGAVELDDAGLDDAELDDAELDDTELDEPIDASVVVLEDLPLPPPPDYDAGFGLTLDRDPAADSWWGAWVSEETPPTTCDAGMLVTGVDCSGSHCDNVQLRCESKTTTDTSRSWSAWFSDEDAPKYCPNGSYVSGIACQGWWCDDVAIECTAIGVPHSCYWTGWFGSDDPWFQTNDGDVVGGVLCGGAYCDQMRFYRCEL